MSVVEFRQWRLLGPESVELCKLARPIPATGEALIRVDAATTCGTDLKVFLRGGHARMLRPPCAFGHEVAGTVLELGGDVEGLGLGDTVVVANSAPCRKCRQCRRGRENLCTDLQYLNGAFADLLLLPERFVERSTYRFDSVLPAAQAALAEPLACAVHCASLVEPFLEQAGAAGPVSAVVVGAGPLGLLLVGVLSKLGFDVASADPNESRLQLARRFGARQTVGVSRETDQGSFLAGEIENWAGVGGADVAIDATGSAAGWINCLSAVREGGHVVFFGGTAQGVEIPIDAHRVHYSEITMHGVYHHRPASFRQALDLLAERALPFDLLLSTAAPLTGLEGALRAMQARQAIKVVIDPSLDANP